MDGAVPIQSYLDLNIQNRPSVQDQHYFAHGKLLLTGEYLIMDGASAIALPTKVGQSLTVKYAQSFNPKLIWNSYDPSGKKWFSAQFEFWRFDIIDGPETKETIFLQKLLNLARKQNTHFLRDDVDVMVDTKLGFPLDWGLGSSSTLIYNIAQWAYISPFKLAFDVATCSGYDIACAQSDGPILYRRDATGPHWETVLFEPPFLSSLYLVYLGKKQDTNEAIKHYKEKATFTQKDIQDINQITQDVLKAKTLIEFEELMMAHEKIIGNCINQELVKEKMFADFKGAIKSLGAWGGDFILVTSEHGENVVREYFKRRAHAVLYKLEDIIQFRLQENHKEDHTYIQ